MFHETPAPSRYAKIPNFPCLYRHTVTGKYYAIKKLHGQRRERSLDTTDRKIAERRLRDWIGSLERTFAEVEKTTVGELKRRLIAINQGKSESSKYIVRSILEEFEEEIGTQTEVRSIRPSQLEEWLAYREQRLKNTSYNRYAGVLKQFFEVAAKDRIIDGSPFELVKTKWKRPQTPHRRVPTVEQFGAILASIRAQKWARHAEKTADFIEFLGLAGLGQAEAASLKWRQVDWGRNVMHIRRHKTDTHFDVPIYPHLRPLLERLKAKAGSKALPTARVFKIKSGRQALMNACERLGYPQFTQRNIRQCLIMRLWKAGVDRKLIAKWQGHQDGGQLILDTYTEVFGDDDADYERQQLAKLGPQSIHAPVPKAPAPAASIRTTPARRRQAPALKFCGMENPYKVDEKLMTKVKGAEVEATVAQVFKNEVQVKTTEGKLLWRTMHTVWRPGESPIPKPDRAKAEPAQLSAPATPVAEPARQSGVPPATSDSSPAEPIAPQPEVAVASADTTPSEPTAAPLEPTAGTDAIHGEPTLNTAASTGASQLTSCGDSGPRKGRKGRKNHK